MSISTHHRPAATSPTTLSIDWHLEHSGLWVARRGDTFAGMVEARWSSGFAATTRLAEPLGTFDTLDEAQHALEASILA